MIRRLLRAIAHLERFAHRPWYTPLISLLALADLFILVIPTDALVISNAALRPRRWLVIALSVTVGSALGAWLLVYGVQDLGDDFLRLIGASDMSSPQWEKAAAWIRDHEAPALALFAVGPFPLQPAVILAGAAGVSAWDVALWVAVGRGVKYFFFAWAATHAPALLKRVWGLRQEMEVMEQAREDDAQATGVDRSRTTG